MNWATVEHVRKDMDQKWYLTLIEVGVILGCKKKLAAEFVIRESVPYYRLGRAKKYFLPEVLEAAEKQRWRDRPAT